MIKFFRKIRQNLLMENKTEKPALPAGKYFKYAIGEIVLVVIGILIALSINNWNEQRKKNNELTQINERLITDMDDDIREISRILLFWQAKKPLFKKVMNDSMSADLFDEGLTRLLTTNLSTTLNTTGVQQLKTINAKDELSLDIINIYDQMENRFIIPFEQKIQEERYELFSKFRDNYKWYTEYVSKTIMTNNSSKELQDYFLTSLEYKNSVSHGHQIIFVNYVRNLGWIIPYLEDLKSELILNNNSNLHAISQEDLEKYEGTYKVTKMELNEKK